MCHATGACLIVKAKGVVVAILVRSTVREVHPVTLNHLWPFALAQWFAPWSLLVVMTLFHSPTLAISANGTSRHYFIIVRVDGTYTAVPTRVMSAPY